MLILMCYSVANDGTVFYLRTNKDAPQYKLVSVDIAVPPEKRVFTDLIPHDENARLQEVLAFNGDHAAVVYKRDVKDEIYVYQLSTGTQRGGGRAQRARCRA